MAWLMRGLQSAVFHYLSCAPCTEYMHRQERKKQAKKDRKARRILEMEQPGLYRHPEPSATNPFWTEEIVMGPGPPPRRARRQTTSSQRAITTAGTQSTMVSQGGSSVDVGSPVNASSLRLSDETLDNDQNWNRRRYQREDEELWGLSHSSDSNQADVRGSSVGIVGISRPETSKSSGESYFIARAPPVNDLHPPVVSVPSPRPEDNRWMLQPPPKASIMSGKERASPRSRSGSGSGASSRVELNLHRQVSARQLRAKIERGQTPAIPPLSREASYTQFPRPKTPQPRPSSAASSRKRRKRRDTAVTPPPPKTVDLWHYSLAHSSDTVIHILPPPEEPATPPRAVTPPTTKLIRVRDSRHRLSTLISNDSVPAPKTSPENPSPVEENSLPPSSKSPLPRRLSHTQSSDSSTPYLTKRRNPLSNSDLSSLNVLQDVVAPATLLEARVRLPESGSEVGAWEDISTREMEESGKRLMVPVTGTGRDVKGRWSVDF